MPRHCAVVPFAGGTAIICGTGLQHCQESGCTYVAEALCDFRVGHGKTCDRRLCARHRNRAGDNIDYCPEHAAAITLPLPLEDNASQSG